MWELGTILPGATLTLRVRLVVGKAGAGVGFGDVPGGQREGDELGAQAPAAVRVERDGAGWEEILEDGLPDELLAPSAHSRWAILQPMTYRLKTSRMRSRNKSVPWAEPRSLLRW